jgi:dihydroflavonol-4-reductase
MTTFVTGANGFLGAHVVRQLMARDEPVVALVGTDVDTEPLAGLDVETRELDLTDAASVSRALKGGTRLIHTAARYSFWEPDPSLIYRVNVQGTENLLAAAAELGYERVVHTSSTATLCPALFENHEDERNVYDPRRFQGHYKQSKVLAESLVMSWAARGLPVVVVNPTVVVGAGDRRPTPTGIMLVHFLNGRLKAQARTTLNVVDVEDAARGHVLALEKGGVGERYILGGENLEMHEVTKLLSEMTGIPPPSFVLPQWAFSLLSHINERFANVVTHRPPLIDRESALHARVNGRWSSKKAEAELGFVAAPAREALAKALRYYLDNGYASARCQRIVERHGGLLAEGSEPLVATS